MNRYMQGDLARHSLLRLVSYCSDVITVVYDENSNIETYLQINVDEEMNIISIKCVANSISSVRSLLFELSCRSSDAMTIDNKELTRILDAYVTVYKGVYYQNKTAPLKLYTVGLRTGVLVTKPDEFGKRRNVLLVNYTRAVRKDIIDMNYAVQTAMCGVS